MLAMELHRPFAYLHGPPDPRQSLVFASHICALADLALFPIIGRDDLRQEGKTDLFLKARIMDGDERTN